MRVRIFFGNTAVGRPARVRNRFSTVCNIGKKPFGIMLRDRTHAPLGLEFSSFVRWAKNRDTKRIVPAILKALQRINRHTERSACSFFSRNAGNATHKAPVYQRKLFQPRTVRVNKYLSHHAYATRRGADELVERGLVFINGKKATLGQYVRKGDTVEVKQKGSQKEYAYVALYKPVGVNTHDEGKETKNIATLLPAEMRKLKLFPLGRLDKDSHGLLILTNDGRCTDRLLNPKYEHEKTYEVKTARPLRANLKEKMEAGPVIEGYKTKPCIVEVLSEKRFRITLTEGKPHQVRRMVVALFNEVADLKRKKVLNISLGSMRPGEARFFSEKERQEFLKLLGLV
jgi:23S rRNA pseudouridine2604 synthase